MDSKLWLAVRMLIGLLFFQHGAEKVWGFAGGRIDHNFSSLHGIAGPLEIVGGLMVITGVFSSLAAFILCGEMAVAYFLTWAPRGLYPIANGGEEAVLFCFAFLWISTIGRGEWFSSPFHHFASTWETHARSVARLVFGSLLLLHGLRMAFGWLRPLAGRRGAAPMALDGLGEAAGYLLLLCGALLIIGYFAKQAAALASIMACAAYFAFALPRGPWPIRNGGTETLLYALIFLWLAIAGAGTWSLDHWLKRAPTDAYRSRNPLRDNQPSSDKAPLPR